MTDAELRGLDAEVHRRVFGRACRPLRYAPALGGAEVPGAARRDPESHAPVPRYSGEIGAAWAVVERLAVLGWQVAVDWESRPDGRGCGQCRLRHPVRGGYVLKLRDTAPLAICKAALAAVGETRE